MPAVDHEDFRPREHPIDDDITFQRKVWRMERIGWGLLLLLVLLTALGLFSEGPLSDRRAVSADGSLEVRYPRFLRRGSRSSLEISLHGLPGAALEVVLAPPFLTTHVVETLQPLPLQSSSDQGGLKLVVVADQAGRAKVHFVLRPDRAGSTRLHIRHGSQSLRLWQYIYP
ncbi:MAG TPA: hypothetical protein VKY70_03940 [Pseudomonas sp.]|jgi:hypothetical protein|nr:hypothetical protein [Pseudomonas sp.]